MTFENIVPVIMSGGAGTRLWPLSRSGRPKQFIPIAGPKSLFQQTIERTSQAKGFAAPVFVGNVAHRFLMLEEAAKAGAKPSNVLLEPFGRNTAAAIAAAALTVAARDADAVMLILPSDHVVRRQEAFEDAVSKALVGAKDGYLCCFGIEPTAPITGYGYLEEGEALGPDGLYRVAAFREKPDADTAAAYLVGGKHSWNSGMFLFKASAVLEAFETLEPEVLAGVKAALAASEEDLDFTRIDADAFASVKDISFDYAVMEKTDKAAFVSAAMGWSDLGSFSALKDAGTPDDRGNSTVGDVRLHACSNSYVHSDGPLVVAQKLDDMIVVVMEDVVMVTPASDDQSVKDMVAKLKAEGRDEIDYHRTVYRPWGSYKPIAAGDRYQAKEIVVYPGKRLSLQKHHHRAEHWVIVEGTAVVTRDDETLLLSENQSVYLPLGAVHRLENPGSIPLRLIEIQSGSYLGADDIVRFEDDFGRKGTSTMV